MPALNGHRPARPFASGTLSHPTAYRLIYRVDEEKVEIVTVIPSVGVTTG